MLSLKRKNGKYSSITKEEKLLKSTIIYSFRFVKIIFLNK